MVIGRDSCEPTSRFLFPKSRRRVNCFCLLREMPRQALPAARRPAANAAGPPRRPQRPKKAPACSSVGGTGGTSRPCAECRGVYARFTGSLADNSGRLIHLLLAAACHRPLELPAPVLPRQR